jgi:hypothetical protein
LPDCITFLYTETFLYRETYKEIKIKSSGERRITGKNFI